MLEFKKEAANYVAYLEEEEVGFIQMWSGHPREFYQGPTPHVYLMGGGIINFGAQHSIEQAKLFLAFGVENCERDWGTWLSWFDLWESYKEAIAGDGEALEFINWSVTANTDALEFWNEVVEYDKENAEEGDKFSQSLLDGSLYIRDNYLFLKNQAEEFLNKVRGKNAIKQSH